MTGPGLFERVDVSKWPIVATETIGADEKLWLAGLEARWLFKPVTTSGHRHGEDWSEKAASHLAGYLDVPCATVELAVRDGIEGALSRDLRPPRHQLQAGALLLLDRGIPGFVPARELMADKQAMRLRPGHSLSNIRLALDGVHPPLDSRLPAGFDAFDTFTGYLILDAWIGNRDRHDENWSVLVPELVGDDTLLCGSYDQAGGLGFNLRDEERVRRLNQGPGHDVEAYACRGTAWRFENGPDQPVRTLVELAVDALVLASSAARGHWLDVIADLASIDTEPLFSQIEAMSVVARRFSTRLLEINGRRLRDECDGRI